MSTETEERCETCRFIYPVDESMTGYVCRRYPPTTGYDYLSEAGWTVWPQVRPIDWCGEWEAK